MYYQIAQYQSEDPILKLRVMVYCIIWGQQIYQKAFLDSLYKYLSFLNVFFNRFYPVEKCGVTPHCLYRDSLTLTSKTQNYFAGRRVKLYCAL